MTDKKAFLVFAGASIIAGLSYLAFGIRNVESDISKKYVSNRATSVYRKDGVYRVDTNVIYNDKNKLMLYKELSNQKLNESLNVKDIPDFIVTFLKEKSYNNHFHVADKCGKWMESGTQPLEMKQVKKYDEQKQDSVLTLELVNQDLPEKELNFFGIGNNIAVLALRNGGKKHSEDVIVIKFKDQQIIDLWFNRKRTPSLSLGEVIDFIRINKARNNGSC